VISPLLDAGKMPNLERLVNRGVMGDLATLSPVLSPMLWTSIATGKRPFKHGVLGFTEPDPHSGGVRPVTNLSRKTRAIWNILHVEGKTSNVVGWWPSHPAEPIRGVMVSNHFSRSVAPVDKPWPMRAGVVHPPRLAERLAGLRVHPQEIQAGQILPFVPDAGKVDQEKDRRLAALAKIIAEASSIHAAATALIQLEPWDFMGVYYDAIDHFSHGFMRYHPPRMEGVSEKDFELYQGVIEGAYRFHDAMLGVLLGLAGPDPTVILLSDHGFHPDHLRPRGVPREPAGPAVQHREHGIFLMAGPGIKQDERLYGASLLDIVPTVLTLYGLSVGEDMDGRPLVSAFERPPEVRTIPSWDDVPGDDGTHPADLAIDPAEAQEAIRQLVALGYIEKPDEDREKAVEGTLREQRYNAARAYMDANRHAEAAADLEELVAHWPDQHRFGVDLVACYQALGRAPEARRALDELLERRTKSSVQATEKLRVWQEEHPDTKPGELEQKERRELGDLRAQASRNPFAIEYLQGVQFLSEGDAETALAYFQNAEIIDPRAPGVHLQKGRVFLEMKQWERAEASFRAALDIDRENAAAHLGLCWSLLRRRRNQDAAQAALDAIALRYFNPAAHHLLGTALHRMGRIPRAVEALKLCLAQNPNYVPAHERLAHIYERRIGNVHEADNHRRLAEEARGRVQNLRDGTALIEPMAPGRTPVASDQAPLEVGADVLPEMTAPLAQTITVVSGLPRTGTSMMMQMLAAGGLGPLTDGERRADASNERGYFEYAPAKAVRRDASWVPEARGRAVKLVAHLLAAMPREARFHYRVVFMERDLREVVASQQDMLRARGKRGADLADDALRGVFDRQLRQIKRLLAVGRFPVLYVRHRDCIRDPAGTAGRVNTFLGGSLDERAMAAAVEPKLYRHRAEAADAAHQEA